MIYKRYLKRILDLFFSILLIILLFPIFLSLIILLRLTMGKHVFFTQKRGGLNGKVFNIIKFRTMISSYDDQGQLLSDEHRLTKLGLFLRRFSLDELPALFNVLCGEMSLVGPRPFLAEYLAYYNPYQKQRHLVVPGITGWAQVNGRNAIGWEEKFSLDVWYVEHQSLWLDMKILYLTILRVFRSNEINNANHITMPKFIGSE